MNTSQDVTSLTDPRIFGDSDPPPVVTDSKELLGFQVVRPICVRSSAKGIDFSPLFRVGRIELPRRFLQGQKRVTILCTNALYLSRLSIEQFWQSPGPERHLELAFMDRPAFCGEIAQSINTRVVTVPDLCHVMCQLALVPYARVGVVLQVLDVHGRPLLVRVLRIEDEVEVRAYRSNDHSVLPRSYMVMSHQ